MALVSERIFEPVRTIIVIGQRQELRAAGKASPPTIVTAYGNTRVVGMPQSRVLVIITPTLQ